MNDAMLALILNALRALRAGSRPRADLASLAALTGRPLTAFRAGFALKTVSCPVNGLIPFCSFVAGFFTTIRTSPGAMNTPFFFNSA